MKRLLILLLFPVLALGQNGSFNNLDVRNTSKLRGVIYPFGAVATSPINPAVHEIAMINNSTFALCRMDFQEFADSIANHIISGYWTRLGDTIYNNDSTFIKLNNYLITDFISGEDVIDWDGYPVYYNNTILGFNSFKKDTRLSDSASYCTLIGNGSGYDSDTLYGFTSVGLYAGSYSNNISSSSALGYFAGTNLDSIYSSTLVGNFVANGAKNLSNCDFIGNSSGRNMTNGEYAFLVGYNTGFLSDSLLNSYTFGYQSLQQSNNINRGIFLGEESGSYANNIQGATTLGAGSLVYSTNCLNPLNIGIQSGDYSDSIRQSVYIGHLTGQSSNDVYETSFIGNESGHHTSHVEESLYLGYRSGNYSNHITKSLFIGNYAGQGAFNIDSCIFIGLGAGLTKSNINNEIWLDNSNSATPLLQLKCSTDEVIFNGDITYGDTFWDDMTVPATQARIGATSKPAYDYDTLGLKWDNTPVDTTNQLVILNYQLPHRWAAGTSIYLHVHYHQSSAADTCEWFKASYKWTDRGEKRSTGYTTIKTTNQTVYTYSDGSLHQIASFPAISGSGHTESSMLQIVLYCYSIADLFTYDMDAHFEINKPGSDIELP